MRSQECELCSLKDKYFLIASHIKPWRNCSHSERMDINNGILLCPNHDRLFDAGYISFAIDGKIIISSNLNNETKLKMQINENLQISYNPKAEDYLLWHYKNCFIK